MNKLFVDIFNNQEIGVGTDGGKFAVIAPDEEHIPCFEEHILNLMLAYVEIAPFYRNDMHFGIPGKVGVMQPLVTERGMGRDNQLNHNRGVFLRSKCQFFLSCWQFHLFSVENID